MENQRTNKELLQSLKGYEAAITVFNKKNYAKAAELFQKITKSPAKEVVAKARVYLSICEQRCNPVKLELKTAEDCYRYGILQLNARDLSSALEHFQRADELQPDQDHVYYAMAAAHSLSGNSEVALVALEAAIQLNPSNAFHAKRDEDFLPLEDSSRFHQLIANPDKRS